MIEDPSTIHTLVENLFVAFAVPIRLVCIIALCYLAWKFLIGRAPRGYLDDYVLPADAEVRIEAMTEADVDAIARIDAALFRHTVGRWRLRRYAKNKTYIGYVAKEGEKVIGFLVCTRGWRTFHVDVLGVHPNVKRRGIGRRLMDEALTLARSQRYRFADLLVARDNKPAQTLYHSLGFRYHHPDAFGYILRARLPRS